MWRHNPSIDWRLRQSKKQNLTRRDPHTTDAKLMQILFRPKSTLAAVDVKAIFFRSVYTTLGTVWHILLGIWKVPAWMLCKRKILEGPNRMNMCFPNSAHTCKAIFYGLPNLGFLTLLLDQFDSFDHLF